MSTIVNPESLSRQTVEELERTARNFARVVVGLLTVLIILSITTYHGYSREAALCGKVDAVDTIKLRSLGDWGFTAIKTVREQCQ